MAEATIAATPKSEIHRYLRYWRRLKPTTHMEYYQRWLFAYASVHTTWLQNVRIFTALRDLPLWQTRNDISRALRKSRAGMYGVRTAGIWGFHEQFWDNPTLWHPKPFESIRDCRDRLVDRMYGLGMAKVSFALELCFPDTCDVVCVDTHICQLYGVNQAGLSPGTYRQIEDHWIGLCKKHRLCSPMVRHIFWDKKQGKSDTRYWSFCLESARVSQAHSARKPSQGAQEQRRTKPRRAPLDRKAG